MYVLIIEITFLGSSSKFRAIMIKSGYHKNYNIKSNIHMPHLQQKPLLQNQPFPMIPHLPAQSSDKLFVVTAATGVAKDGCLVLLPWGHVQHRHLVSSSTGKINYNQTNNNLNCVTKITLAGGKRFLFERHLKSNCFGVLLS